MPLLLVIGLDDPLPERIAAAVDARVVAYQTVPACYALDGQLYVESARVMGRWLQPDGVVYYSYFEGAELARRALALAATPTFPDVATTLLHDDRVQSLLLASRADGHAVPRGFAPPGQELRFEGERVFKWSNRHCGDDKARQAESFTAQQATLVEPFFEGTSERILIVGDAVFQLGYESDDWRKNVGARVRVRDTPDAALVERARDTARKLGLRVVGIDYLITRDAAILLEVNAYPGLGDAPGAEDAFIAEVARWWTQERSEATS